MTRAIIYSLVICAGRAALEGLFGGRGVKRRLAELHQPAMPSIMGLDYY
jgi:hypothetical protein